MNTLLAFLKDPNDNLSSKRLVGLGAFASLVAVGWFCLLTNRPAPTEFMNDLMLCVGMGVLGAIVDHFPGGR